MSLTYGVGGAAVGVGVVGLCEFLFPSGYSRQMLMVL